MQPATLEILPELKDQLDHLAGEMHRSEIELANEAVALYIEHQRRILDRIHLGIAQADRGEFVADDEMEDFFSRYGQPGA